MLNALSFDIEEHFQVHGFERVISRNEWETFQSRVVANTRRILNLLAEHNVHATFFVLGWVADRQPELVRQIACAGHELAVHGYSHELIYRQTPEEFAADLQSSIAAVERALASACPQVRSPRFGYRAPAFSITRQSLWAFDVLQRCRIRYDASIFPLVAHDRYGINGAERFAHRLHNGMWEFPATTLRLLGRNWPVVGGGYFRLVPLWVTRAAIRRINAEGHPAIIYLHPWEFDPAQPRVSAAPRLSRFRHYVNLAHTEQRLRTLLSEFRFAPINVAFARCLGGAS